MFLRENGIVLFLILPILFGRINNRVSKTPKRVEKELTIKVGKMMSLGAALCMATRTATSEEGKICKEVALSTKNIAEEYSALSVLSKSCAVFTPYGVAAPEMPSILTEKLIHAVSTASSLLVFKIRRASGFKMREILRAKPLSSHTFIRPIHTE